MAEILSLHAARLAADRAAALSYLERMTAFQAEMRHLTDRFGILGGAGAEIVEHPALRHA